MEIAGHKLFLPANYSFLRRLPARFEILVTGKGAEKSGLIAFELEVNGQRIVLKSGVELKVGARYELEKINETQFRLLRLVAESDTGPEKSVPVGKVAPGGSASETPYVVLNPGQLQPSDLLAVKLLVEAEKKIERRENKFFFDWDKNYALSGVFVPLSGGGYTLFLAGAAAGNGFAEKLTELMADLPVKSIRSVSRQVLESIAAGAIDLKS